MQDNVANRYSKVVGHHETLHEALFDHIQGFARNFEFLKTAVADQINKRIADIAKKLDWHDQSAQQQVLHCTGTSTTA